MVWEYSVGEKSIVYIFNVSSSCSSSISLSLPTLLCFFWLLESQDQKKMNELKMKKDLFTRLRLMEFPLVKCQLFCCLEWPHNRVSCEPPPPPQRIFALVKLASSCDPLPQFLCPATSTTAMTRGVSTDYLNLESFHLKGKEFFEQRCYKDIHLWPPSKAAPCILQ